MTEQPALGTFRMYDSAGRLTFWFDPTDERCLVRDESGVPVAMRSRHDMEGDSIPADPPFDVAAYIRAHHGLSPRKVWSVAPENRIEGLL